jgi:plasmid maintenance system antidote protein VapI
MRPRVSLRDNAGEHASWLEYLRDRTGDRATVGTARWPERLDARELETFAGKLPMLYPDRSARADILRLIAKKLQVEGLDADQISGLTEWWSGADLVTFAEEASQGTCRSRESRERAVERMTVLINKRERINRTLALLKFTEEHGTSRELWSELSQRYADLRDATSKNAPAHITYNSNFITKFVEHEVTIMGDYIRTGNVTGSIVGKNINNANVHTTINDLAQVADALRELREQMVQRAASPEHYVAIGAISEAEIAAKEGNQTSMLTHLKKAGRWALSVANEVGVQVAAAAIANAIDPASR